MGSNSTFSVIGADVTITGDVRSTVDLHVDGRIEGDLECASLVQGESGTIEGAIVAETAKLAGTIKGSIRARELSVLRTARIEGDVEYEALTIEQGASVEGRFAQAGRDKPATRSSQPAAGKTPGDGNADEPALTLAG